MPEPTREMRTYWVYSPDFTGQEVTDFIQGMFNRTGVSYHKYGSIQDGYPHPFSALDQIIQRLKKYEETHNKEWLMDAANYALIEFLCPSFEDAHYRPTDSDESPGRIRRDGSISHGRDG